MLVNSVKGFKCKFYDIQYVYIIVQYQDGQYINNVIFFFLDFIDIVSNCVFILNKSHIQVFSGQISGLKLFPSTPQKHQFLRKNKCRGIFNSVVHSSVEVCQVTKIPVFGQFLFQDLTYKNDKTKRWARPSGLRCYFSKFLFLTKFGRTFFSPETIFE